MPFRGETFALAGWLDNVHGMNHGNEYNVERDFPNDPYTLLPCLPRIPVLKNLFTYCMNKKHDGEHFRLLQSERTI